MATEDQIITSIIDTIEALPLAEVSDQLTTILCKYQVSYTVSLIKCCTHI